MKRGVVGFFVAMSLVVAACGSPQEGGGREISLVPMPEVETSTSVESETTIELPVVETTVPETTVVETTVPETTVVETTVEPNGDVAHLDPNPNMADVIAPSSITAGETIRVAGTWSMSSGIGFIALEVGWEISPGFGMHMRCEAGSEPVWETEIPRASVTEVLTCILPTGIGDGLYTIQTMARKSRLGGETVSSHHELSIFGGSGVASGPIVSGLSFPSSVQPGDTVEVTGTWAHKNGVAHFSMGITRPGKGGTIVCEPGSEYKWSHGRIRHGPSSVTTTLTCILPSNVTSGTYTLLIGSEEALVGYSSHVRYDLLVGD